MTKILLSTNNRVFDSVPQRKLPRLMQITDQYLLNMDKAIINGVLFLHFKSL